MSPLRAALVDPLVDTRQTLRRNRAFVAGLSERSGGRSWALLVARTDQVRRGPQGRQLQWGRLPWTSPEFGLQRHAEAAALEAAIAEDLDLARWLCDEILDSGRSAAAQGVRALLAVHDGDLAAARRLRERETKVLAGAYSPAAAAWVTTQAQLLAARRAHLAHAAPGTGDAASRWAQAQDDPRGRAGAVAEASRVGVTGSTGAAFEDAFARALISGAPESLGPWAAVLAPRPDPVRDDRAELGAVTGLTVLTRRELRALVAGRPVVFDPAEPVDDPRAVVVRTDHIPAGAGRTDVHVVTDPATASWAVPVDVRLVLGARRAQWQQVLRARLRPKAQRCVGDDELRRTPPDAVADLLRGLAAS